MQSRAQKIEYLRLLQERNKRNARTNLLDFTKYTFKGFEPAQFHKIYYHLLTLFAKGKIKKLIATMPPQHGKSEGSTRRLPAFIHGLNPNAKIAIGSYNTTFARKFNRDVQRIIDEPSYFELYPETTLNGSNVVTVTSSYLRNSEEFEIVGHTGSLKAVGRGGALTGNTVDFMLMDDLYKDYAEGNSPIIRAAVWDWYTSVVRTRLHNDSQELIVFTRWHEEDLIGQIQKKEEVIELKSLDQLESIPPRAWVKVNFQALKESETTEIDQRAPGLPLWPTKHNAKKLEEVRELDPENFNCLYQGDPQSSEGLLYSPFATYNALPELKIVKNYTDTADTGTDYLSSIVYGLPLDPEDEKIYIIDLLFTTEPMELTEGWTSSLLINNKVNQADVESNNGGRGFARVIDQKTPESITVSWFNQSQNKEARIFSNSATVNKKIVFPADWASRFREFYDHITRYKKNFKANKNDDGPDVLTGIIEKNQVADFWAG